jgi:hypothetical protein
MKFHTFVATLVGLSLITGGCTAAISGQLSNDPAVIEANADANQAVTIISQDGSIQLAAPKDWQSTELSEADVQQHVVLKLTTRNGNMQMGIMAVPKGTAQAAVTTEVLKDAVATSAEAIVGKGSVTSTSLTSVNGMPTTQYEGHGEFAGEQVGVLATGVDTPDVYYNILVIGYEFNFDQMRDEVDQMIQSFQPTQS